MIETIKEGSTLIKIKKTSKISKEMEVFYNPIMKLNRDISVLLLNAIGKPDMNVCLPLAGSGIRGVRFLKELDEGILGVLSLNDYSEKAIDSIKKNLALNGIKGHKVIKSSNNIPSNKKIKRKKAEINIYNEDANLFMLNGRGFDYIDVDPFGTSNPFLDAAIKRISRDGILAVTNTDTAGLAGTYPTVCKRLYWATPKLDAMKHETGLRILIRKIQLVGVQYDKALIPIFSYFKDHYFRIFFRCVKGKKECDSIIKQHGMFKEAGPLWLGKLWDSKLTSDMYKISVKDSKETEKSSIKSKAKIKENNNSKELLRFLETIKEESKINSVGFYDTHGKGKKKIFQKEVLIEKIKKKGYKAASTHFTGTAIRTDIEEKKLKKINP